MLVPVNNIGLVCLRGDPVDEDEDNLNTKEMENLEHGVQIPSSNTYMAQVKSKVLGGGCVHSHRRGSQNQEMQTAAPSSQQIASFTSYSSNVLDFSNSRPEKQSSDRSPEVKTTNLFGRPFLSKTRRSSRKAYFHQGTRFNLKHSTCAHDFKTWSAVF